VAKTILKLDSDDPFDFILAGIACQHKDYRLCHELNSTLQIGLARDSDYEIFNGKRMEKLTFPFYHYKNEEGDRYFLLSNKGKPGVLIPEQKQIDYFLMIKENVKRINEQELLNKLKTVKVVLGIFKFDASQLKSRDNLLF
jgi:hypothetical protein